MRAHERLALIVVVGCILNGCKSNANNTPTCSLDDPATLAVSSWPKFRRDRANTGSIDNVHLSTTAPTLRWVFAASPNERFQASPVLNNNDELIYIGSTNGTLYVVSAGDTCIAGSKATSFALTAQFGITSTALMAFRDGKDAVFVGGDNGLLYAVDGTGVVQQGFWPFAGGGSVSASPNLSVTNGIVYDGSLAALFFGVCPNGIARFNSSTTGVGSSAAVGPDGTVYFGADDGQLRAVDANGVFQWTFSTSAPIVDTAPVVEVDNGVAVAIYVANAEGLVFKVDPSGRAFQQPVTFDFSAANHGPVGAIHTSPALAGDHLYFGSDDGSLYAIDKQTGQIVWNVFTSTDGIASSPAVATLPSSVQLCTERVPEEGITECVANANTTCQDDTDCPASETCAAIHRVAVVGSNDGNVYFVQDAGSTCRYETFRTGAAVRSSPAIAQDGTVYVGADDGRLYAIGAPLQCGAPPTPTPTPTPIGL